MKYLTKAIAVLLVFGVSQAMANFHHMGSWTTAFFYGGSEVPMMGDFNGDGLDDLIKFTRGALNQVHVRLSERGNFRLLSGNWSLDFSSDNEVPMVGHFDIGNKTDIISFEVGGAQRVWVATVNDEGTGFDAKYVGHPGFCPAGAVPFVGDFNGDNLDDIAYVETGGVLNDVYVALNDPMNPGNFMNVTLWRSNFSPSTGIVMAGKFDNNNTDDIVCFSKDGTGMVFVSLSNGNGFENRVVWNTWFCPNDEVPQVGDLDGDGVDDILTFTRGALGEVYVAFSNDMDGFVPEVSPWISGFAEGTTAFPLVGDVNGYGELDIVNVDENALNDYTIVAVGENSHMIDLDLEPFVSGKAQYMQRAEPTFVNLPSNEHIADLYFRFDLRNFDLNYEREIESIVFHIDGQWQYSMDDIEEVIPAIATKEIYQDKQLVITFPHLSPPQKLKLVVNITGMPDVFTKEWDLEPYYPPLPDQAFLFPFKLIDMTEGGYWSSKAFHTAGAQAHGYDLRIQKRVEVDEEWEWTMLEEWDADSAVLDNWLAYGKPIYSMASGVIIAMENSLPENSFNNLDTEGKPVNVSGTTSGNYLDIDYEGVRVRYSHLITGSIPASFTVGDSVFKSEQIGQVGFSGNTRQWPHLHMHAWRIYTGTNTNLRSITFYGAESIAEYKMQFDEDGKMINSSDWYFLDKVGLQAAECRIIPLDFFHDKMLVNEDTNKEPLARKEDAMINVQLYPNPSPGITTLEFTLPSAAPVEVLILDRTGKVVHGESQQNYKAGTYTLNLELQALSAGVYYVEVRAGSAVEIKPLVLKR